MESRAAAPLDHLDKDGIFQMNLRKEINMIEKELKDWFITRLFNMERHMAIKKMLDSNNFIGFSLNNPHVPDAQRIIWTDLLRGKPELDDNLSLDAKEMKAEKYMSIFKDSTDIDNPCRLSGVKYLSCLRKNYMETTKVRSTMCFNDFNKFDSCRRGLQQQQSAAFEISLQKQKEDDLRAKGMFERRCKLIDKLSGTDPF